MIQVLHNPRCGKSRNCLAFLADSNKKYEVIYYLENPLSITALKELLNKLNLKPIALVRQKEVVWIENYKGKTLTDEEILTALTQYPILIERPIIIDGNRAVIGRELDKLKDFFLN